MESSDVVTRLNEMLVREMLEEKGWREHSERREEGGGRREDESVPVTSLQPLYTGWNGT